jgi:anaerobic selenocysteine-containing dehydrogenase
MANIIISEGLYDQDFVRDWTYGFEEYRAHVAQYSPQWAAEVCDLDVEDIYAAARLFANAKPASMQWGVALDHTKGGYFTGIAVMDLIALTGNFEKPGGVMIGIPYWGITQGLMGARPAYGEKVLPDEQLDKRINDNHPLMTASGTTSPDDVLLALETGKPYPVRALWLLQTNPLTCQGSDPHRLHAALLKSEFTVMTDLFMTPTILAVADVVLPACTFAERIGITGHHTFNLGSIVKAVDPLGESRSDQEIINDICKRFNPEGNPWEHDLGIYNWILQKAGSQVDYDYLKKRTWAFPQFEYHRHEKGLLRKDGKPGFNTATGKFEFKVDAFEWFDLPVMPVYEEPPESPVSRPDLAKLYPYVLTTGARRWGLFHSEHRNSPSMRRIHKWPEFMIHPKLATELGIEEGDWCRIENNHGHCRMRAHVSPRIREDTISTDHAWWFPERGADDGTFFGTFESNINCLLPYDAGDSGYCGPFKALLCKVVKE